MVRALALLGASILVWLGSAYCLEMRGMAVHRGVWMASVLYFFANVHLLGAVLTSVRSPSPSGTTAAATAALQSSSSPSRTVAGAEDDKKVK